MSNETVLKTITIEELANKFGCFVEHIDVTKPTLSEMTDYITEIWRLSHLSSPADEDKPDSRSN